MRLAYSLIVLFFCLGLHATTLPTDFPAGQEGNLANGQVVNTGKSFQGVKFWVSFGPDVTPLEAAALWWDLPAQTEIFGGTLTILSSSMKSQRFEASIAADLPGGVQFVQKSYYSVAEKEPGVYRITVDAYSGQPLFRDGLGVYRFFRHNGETIYEGTSLLDPNPGVPIEVLNASALQAAQAHADRYRNGGRPTKQQLKRFKKALKDSKKP